MNPNFRRRVLYKSPEGEEKILECIIAIIQDSETKNVLMQGFINQKAWKKTQETRFVHLWSMSRDELWPKGETSGNKMEVVCQFLDCDLDAVTIEVKVHGDGVACHTGQKSCFFNEVA